MKYIIRDGFTITKGNIVYLGGEEIELEEKERDLHRHRLEGIEKSVSAGAGQSSDQSQEDCCFPAPHFDRLEPRQIFINISSKTRIQGSYFTPDTTVSASVGTVEAVEFISDNELELTLRHSEPIAEVELVFDNGDSIRVPNALDFVELPAALVDLRSTGSELNEQMVALSGSRARYNRDSTGLGAYGTSYIAFTHWGFRSNEFKTLTWIYQANESCKVGIGTIAGVGINQAHDFGGNIVELVSDNFGSQTLNFIKEPSDIIKIVLTNSGSNGGTFSAYRLKDADVYSWFDTSELLGEVRIEVVESAPEEILYPFAMPGAQTKLIGFILEDGVIETND